MIPRSPRFADKRFVVGEVYRLQEVSDRTAATHSHQFAWLNEAWKNLPESLADLYPSPDHLRKRALVEAGFYTEEIIDAGSNAAALRVASYVRSRDEFAVVIVRGPAVVVRHPKSQSYRAMDKKEFQDSKTAIMEIVASMVGVAPDELIRESGKAA